MPSRVCLRAAFALAMLAAGCTSGPQGPDDDGLADLQGSPALGDAPAGSDTDLRGSGIGDEGAETWTSPEALGSDEASADDEGDTRVGSDLTGSGGDLPEVGEGDNLVQLARAPGSTFIEIVDVRARSDGFVFLCSAVQGLVVVNARDPEAPEVVATVTSKFSRPILPRCMHVAFDDDVAVFTNRGDEIEPIPYLAAFDSTSFQEIDAIAVPGHSFEGVDVEGGRIHVAAHQSGLATFALEGGRLRHVGTLEGFHNAWAVEAHEGMAYVGDGAGGFVIAETGPAARIRGRLVTPGPAISVALDPERRIAYVAAGSGGLVSIDVRDPDAPVLLAEASTPGSAAKVGLSGTGQAIVAAWRDTRIYDVRDRSRLSLLAREAIPMGDSHSRVLGAAMAGDIAFLGEWTGLYTYRFHSERFGPDLVPSVRQMDFAAAPGDQDARALILRNEGTVAATIESAWVELSADFHPDAVDLTIPPGGAEVIEVLFAPTFDTPQWGTLVLATNDPDESLMRIALRANEEGQRIGSPSRPLSVSMRDGSTWWLTDALGKVVVLAFFSTF